MDHTNAKRVEWRSAILPDQRVSGVGLRALLEGSTGQYRKSGLTWWLWVLHRCKLILVWLLLTGLGLALFGIVSRLDSQSRDRRIKIGQREVQNFPWNAQVKDSTGDDVREGVRVSSSNIEDLKDSRGQCNFQIKFVKDARKSAYLTVVPLKNVTRSMTGEDDGRWVPFIAFDCRGMDVTGFHPEVCHNSCASKFVQHTSNEHKLRLTWRCDDRQNQ